MEATVKQELSLFLNKQISADSLCSVDDIVLGYIVSVLEQLGEDEQFDVDEFAEIMAAYIPGFDTVNKEDVCDWMLGLADKLVNTRTSNNQMKEDKTLTENKDLSSPSSMSANDNHTGNASDGFSSLQRQESCTSGGKTSLSPGCTSTHPNQETINGTQKDKTITDSASDAISVLAELFPEACSLELEHCLRVANGNTESAVQLMLLKDAEDNDEEGKENCCGILDFSPKAHLPSAKRQEPQKTDQVDLKEQMMARYGYVDVSQDEKTHQPVFNKQESKKLVRYRNNQVVSTKGERFSWEKQEESEEMKKTYVNLKPARKYRFH